MIPLAEVDNTLQVNDVIVALGTPEHLDALARTTTGGNGSVGHEHLSGISNLS